MTLFLYDTATGTSRELKTREPGKVSMYICGPTVYGPPHLGHGRHALVFDILRRHLTWEGYSVTHVSNITDVDDKIINKARADGRSEVEVATEFEAVWFDSMDRLGVQRPTHVPHATQYIERMVEMLAELISRDMAYETPDGVYLAVEKVHGYGVLARQPLCELRVGARIAVDEAKRSPLDFALWKKCSADTGVVWPSPWGDGRPGWHTECVVMSLDLLGEDFDLHGGGQDLTFPHHENERAQAEALGLKFANHWMHNGFITGAGDKKMGKSEKNTRPLEDAFVHDPRSYRLLVLQSHYRAPVQVTDQTLLEAARTLARVDGYLQRAGSLPAAEPSSEIVKGFRDRMNDDLDTPGAMAIVFGAIHDVNGLIDKGLHLQAAPIHAAIVEVLTAVGIKGEKTEERRPPHEVRTLMAERARAREAQNWASADFFRTRIEAFGWTVTDTPSGQVAERLGVSAGSRTELGVRP